MRGAADRPNALAWPPALLLVAGTASVVWLQMDGRAAFREAFFAELAILTGSLALLALLQRGPRWPRALLASRAELAGFLLVVAAGIAMRVVGFDSFPPSDGQAVEESQMGAGAFAAFHQHDLDAFFPLPTLTGELGFRLLGSSITTLRLPFVALGVLSVPLFFVAARLFFASYAAAFFASGLFATSTYLAGSSRVALESMSPIATACFALAATFGACVRRDAFSGALAGFANGLVFAEYFSFKLVPVPAAFLMIGCWLQDDGSPYCNAAGSRYRWANLRRSVVPLGLGALFGAALLVAVLASNWGVMPVLEGYLRHRIDFEQRPLTPADAIVEAASRAALSARFVFSGGGGFDVQPMSMGLLDPVTGWLAVAGLVWCAVAGRRCPAKRFLVVASVLLVVLSGALVAEPSRHRLVPLIPYACLAAGVIVDDLAVRMPNRRRAIGAVTAAALIAIAVLNAQRFFGVAVHDRALLEQFDDPEFEVGAQLGALQARDPGKTVYFLSDRAYFGTVNDYFFLYDVDRVKVVAATSELVGKRGLLLTHSPFLDEATAIPGLSACRRWPTRNRSMELMTCALPSAVSEAQSR